MPLNEHDGQAQTPKIRVMTVDDHELLRHGISFALLSSSDIEVVAEAQNGPEALRVCETAQPDVILMDLYLGGEMDGIATTRAIRARYPNVQVLALSSFHDRELVHGAMQAGAIGFLVKGVSSGELANAIRAAHVGQPTLSAEPLRDLIQPPPTRNKPGNDLTAREIQVLALLAEGTSNAEIAEKLVVSVAAVKYHVSSILSKLGAANRTEAAALARQYNLLPKK